MTTIILKNGIRLTHSEQLEDIQPTKVQQLVRLDDLIARLGAMRADWEASVPNLEQVAVPLPLVLADMAGIIGLTPEETREVLGNRLYALVEEQKM